MTQRDKCLKIPANVFKTVKKSFNNTVKFKTFSLNRYGVICHVFSDWSEHLTYTNSNETDGGSRTWPRPVYV